MGREVEWHPNFKLYISTRLLNPNPSPEFCSRAAVIDFSVSRTLSHGWVLWGVSGPCTVLEIDLIRAVLSGEATSASRPSQIDDLSQRELADHAPGIRRSVAERNRSHGESEASSVKAAHTRRR